MTKHKSKKETKLKKEESVENIESTEKLQEESNNPRQSSEADQIAAEKDKFLRLFAEFENYKKRTSRERMELFKTANKELMTALLPVLDDFDRALLEINKAEDDVLFKGVSLIQSKFKNILASKGLTLFEVQAGDVFDADLHQAITQIPAPSEEMKGKIIDVTESGYKLGENIIRFPKVVVGN